MAKQMDYCENSKIEIQDIFAKGATAYLNKFPTNSRQRKAIYSIMNCRGEQLGRHIDKCDHCGHTEISYNSCRNRHCPKCQLSKQQEWVERLQGTILPVPYFHLVFTLPHALNDLVYKYQKDCYSLMFKASAQTVLQIASRPGFLGARTGCLSVLHTWGQNLQYHPHIHMLVPAGGMSEDQIEWVSSGKKFFIPVKVLSKVFRGKFMTLLKDFINQENIQINFPALKTLLYKNDWVVYSKKCFAGPGQVLSYLGRYTHRVAISNSRIIDHKQGKVCFRWKDYRHNNYWKTMQLDVLEFIRRYLLHVLPVNFYKIRYYGILSLANRKQMLLHCMSILNCQQNNNFHQTGNLIRHVPPVNYRLCPICHAGTLRFFAILPAEISEVT